MKNNINTKIYNAILKGINEGLSRVYVDDFDQIDVDNDTNEYESIDVHSGKDEYDHWYILKHEFVDLGLPSGTLWCTHNLGADDPNQIGDFFAWGETSTKEVFNRETYKFFKNNGFSEYWKKTIWEVTKYITLRHTIFDIDGPKLENEDDAAYEFYNNTYDIPAKVPSVDQVHELVKYCTLQFIPDTYAPEMVICTSKNNEKQIKLPLTRLKGADAFYYENLVISHINCINGSDDTQSYIFQKCKKGNSGTSIGVSTGVRSFGAPIRPVISKEDLKK